MVKVVKHGILLKKTDFGFENAGVLNPAAIRVGEYVHLFYRALRNGNYSTIGYCRLDGPLTIGERFDMPVLFPQTDAESQGIEDPRVTKLDGVYYMSYTAYDGLNALGAYAIAENLPHFEKKGILSHIVTYEDFRRLAESKSPLNEKYARYNSQPLTHQHTDKRAYLWNKNVVFFPRRINGKIFFLHRIKPDIQIVSVHNMEDLTVPFWEDYALHFQDNILLVPKYAHEISYIGGGCPPIETEHGWLIIYHGVHDTVSGYRYVACAALLDLEDPTKEITRLPYALFGPDADYELTGIVNNVCFPTGAALFDDDLYLYYGAADEQIACASLKMPELLDALLEHAKNPQKPALT